MEIRKLSKADSEKVWMFVKCKKKRLQQLIEAFAESDSDVMEIVFKEGVDYKNASACNSSFAKACRISGHPVRSVCLNGHVYLIRTV